MSSPLNWPAEAVVYVVDDDASVREALASLLRSFGLSVEAFADAASFLDHPRTPVPSCVVLDVRMPGMTGLELQQRLNRTTPSLPIVFITGHGDIPMAVRAVKAGAIEFLPKPFRDEDLLAAVKQALRASMGMRSQVPDLADVIARANSLTEREREVADFVVAGLRNKQIAAQLGLSEVTVKVHRRSVMSKMSADSLAELIRLLERLRRQD